MTAQLLASELSNLIQESKRKHNDLRQVPRPPFLLSFLSCLSRLLVVGFPIPVFFTDTSQAAEKSLDELKSLKTTTEAQIGSGRAPLCPLTWGQPQGIFLS